jgi:serine/threonine protein kinase
MELCSGGSLADLIGNRVDPNEIDRIAYGILSGLKDLHNEGIIHRDIKPENVLFDEYKTPKLADFGISASVKKRHTVANHQGYAKQVFVTGTYSPPEQMDQKRAMTIMGPRNDIYAFGIMMYELISRGAYPFGPFEDFMKNYVEYEQRKKNQNWDRETLRKYAEDEKWEYVIERCIKYNPEDRYQNVTELLADIGFKLSGVFNERKTIHTHTIWKLRIQNGEEIGQTYNLTNLSTYFKKNSLTIGWLNPDDPFSNDIGIKEDFTQYISRYHATLELCENTKFWKLRDGQNRVNDVQYSGELNWKPSTNGVLVQGKKIDSQGVILQPNDIIIIGDTTLKVIAE